MSTPHTTATTAAPGTLSDYSFLPYPHVEANLFKKLLLHVKDEGCTPEELSDAYESLGLSQLLDGDHAEAATNLECACIIQEDTLKGGNDERLEHKLRTKFWVSDMYTICCFLFLILYCVHLHLLIHSSVLWHLCELVSWKKQRSTIIMLYRM